MRTMLIPIILVLVCSQYFTAGVYEVKNCGGESGYACLVPNMCLPENVATMEKSAVVGVYSYQQIGEEYLPKKQLLTATCPIMFRYYPYSPRWMHIEMEFVGNMKPGKNEMIFTHTQSDSTIINEFKCEIDKDKKTKLVTRKIKGKNGIPEPKPMIETPGTVADLKKCVFDVRSNEKDIFTAENGDRIFLKVGSEETKHGLAHKLLAEVRCDPNKLKFNPDQNSTRVYAKVLYDLKEPGKYFCERPEIFKMEHRPRENGKQERKDYTDVDAKGVDCKGSEFHINGNKFEAYDPIHIRCVADVKYFCNYETIAISGTEQLKLVPPDYVKKTGTELVCPGKTHLVVRGKVVENPQIKCVNYENTQYWTLYTAEGSHLLTPSFADAYCTNELKCNQKAQDKIRLVEQGDVDHNGLPKCPPKGTLQVDGKEINTPSCDKTTGTFMYTLKEGGGAAQPANSQTKFFCFLPEETDTEADRHRTMVLAVTGFVSLVAVFLVVAATNVGVFFISKRRMEALKAKKAQLEKEKRNQNMNDGVFMKYCYTSEEKGLMDDGYNPDKLVTKEQLNDNDEVEKVVEFELLDEKDLDKPQVEAGIKWGKVVMDHVSKYESKFKEEEVVDGPMPDFVVKPEWNSAYKNRLVLNPASITNPLDKMPQLRRIKPGNLKEELLVVDPKDIEEEQKNKKDGDSESKKEDEDAEINIPAN